MRKVSVSVLFATMMFCGSLAIAQDQQFETIDGSKHPNLAAAQHLCSEANQKIIAAQHENKYDMSGHAQKAQQLLVQASQELKAAAETANKADASKEKSEANKPK